MLCQTDILLDTCNCRRVSQPSQRKKIMNEKNINQNPKKVVESEKLPFAKNEVYRLMRENLDDDKMIRDQVKVEMNRFLYSILVNVCRHLNEYPYTTIEYEMLKECIYPYTNIERINEEKQRILMHLDAIKADCDALAMDVEKSLRLKDTTDEDSIADFSANNEGA